MTPNLGLALVAGVLVACGVYLMLERSLTRILVGVLLASNGVNITFLVVSGAAGGAPIIGVTAQQDMSDPLPQAMVLTAIVITLGVTAYLLTLAYRSFQLNGHDEVADDVEDAAIRRLADEDLASDSYESATGAPDEIGQGTADEEGERIGDAPAHALFPEPVEGPKGEPPQDTFPEPVEGPEGEPAQDTFTEPAQDSFPEPVEGPKGAGG